jgi:hypothetical protein
MILLQNSNFMLHFHCWMYCCSFKQKKILVLCLVKVYCLCWPKFWAAVCHHLINLEGYLWSSVYFDYQSLVLYSDIFSVHALTAETYWVRVLWYWVYHLVSLIFPSLWLCPVSWSKMSAAPGAYLYCTALSVKTCMHCIWSIIHTIK